MNLPHSITKGSKKIGYVYDASGRKLANKLSGKTKYYFGNFVYTDDKLDYMICSEGLLNINATTKESNYEFHIKDHLGNTRVAVNETNDITQTSNYYPFGLTFAQSGSSTNKYLYNGKELQEETGFIDYGARQLDKELGRWFNIDPLAEEVFGINPYNYCFNNPIIFIDPTGMMGESLSSTFVDVTGEVIEHRDDDDPTVYMVLDQDKWEKGGKNKDELPIVGWEDWREDYEKGDQYTYYNPTKDPEYDGQYMIPASAYDYSQKVIDGKFTEDWTYYVYGGPWYKFGSRWRKIFLRDLSSDSNRGVAIESGVDIVLAGAGSKVTGWISRKIFGSLPPSLKKKFIKAIANGVVPPTGQQGVIRLTASEIAEKGLKGYTHKLKILGKGGDLRIYGRMGDNGHIVFDKIMGH